jgi:hypothetical protein
MGHSRFALASVRKDRGARPFHLFAPTRLIADSCFLSARSSCRTRLFPSHDPDGCENLTVAVRHGVATRIGADVGARDVLAYTLAVLASRSYRERAGEALKHDYPVVPWPRDAAAFFAIASAGHALDAALHGDVAPCAQALPHVAPNADVTLDDLVMEPTLGRVSLKREVLLEGIDARAFSTELGHYVVIESAFKVERVWSHASVVQMLMRLTRWLRALDSAELAFVTHSQLT